MAQNLKLKKWNRMEEKELIPEISLLKMFDHI